MKKKYWKINSIICVTSFVIALLTLIIFASAQQSSASHLVSDVVFPLNKGWEYQINDANKTSIEELPAYLHTIKSNDEIVFYNSLPNSFVDDMALMFYNDLSSFNVVVDGEKIYSYGENINRRITKSAGSAWHIIRLKEEWEGKEIEVHFKASYSHAKKQFSTFYVGNASNCSAYLLKNAFIPLLCSAIILAVSIAVLTASLLFWRGKAAKSLLYLSLVGVVSSIFFFSASGHLQILLPYPYINHLISYFSLALIAIPFLCYMLEAYIFHKEKILRGLLVLNLINLVVICILPLFKIDFHQSASLSHLCLLISAMGVGYVIINEVYVFHTASVKPLALLCAGLVLCLVFNVVRYYLLDTDDYVSGLRLMILLFIIILAAKEMHSVVEADAEKTKQDELIRRAFYDHLTGCLINNQFQYSLDDLQNDGKEHTNLSISVYNLIRVPEINKQEDFILGNQCLCVLADILNETFSDIGKVYRIGGNTFAVLLENTDIMQLSHRINLVNQRLDELKKELNLYEYSYGYEYYGEYKQAKDIFYRALQKMNNRKEKILSETK